MKTMDEIYEELQNEKEINELNEEWKELTASNKKQIKISGIICVILDIFIIIFIRKIIMPNLMLPLSATLLIVVISNAMIFIIGTVKTQTEPKQLNFNKKYKNIVLRKIISNFYNNLEYFPYKEMPEYIYRDNGYEFFDKYNSSNYFEAQIDNKYNIQMAEVETTKEEEYTDSQGEKETRTITVFQGLFAKIVIDKSINSDLRIMQDRSFKYDKNRLNMDSSEFEKYFDVKASDSIMAMQLLTADVMEELVKFENKTNMKYDVYIRNNEIYLRFHSGTMSFYMGELKEGVLDKNLIHKYFYTLNFTYNLANKLINIINDTQI